MKTKILSVALLLFACETVLSAQEEIPPLVSSSTVCHTVLVQPPSTCLCFPTHPVVKKQGPTLSVDIPVTPFWDMVKEDRIQNHSIQFGETATPWRDTNMVGGWPIPRVNFMADNFRTTAEGGIMKTLKVSPSRTMEQVRGFFEGSMLYVLIGAEGFFGQEQIPLAIRGINFDADFHRRSFGRQGWLGLKFGSFNRNFIAGRYGRGYARTEGRTRFNVPDINELEWFPLYFEEFKTVSFSVETRVRVKRISQSVRLDGVEYERVIPSPDPLRFGENYFEDMWLRTETEIIPFSNARFLRGVVIFTKDFRGQNRLMFTNDYSSVRVLLRLAFN